MDIDFPSKQSIMKDVVNRCLEDITFSVVEPFMNQHESTDIHFVESFISVSFESAEIIMKLSLDTEYLNSVIATLYPNSVDNTLHYEDTIDEITNTICGTFFRRLEPELGTFRLTVPYHSLQNKVESLTTFKFLVDDTHLIEIDILH